MISPNSGPTSSGSASRSRGRAAVAERAAAARPEPRRDQGDLGGQHDQRRVEGELELGYAEAELELEGREPDQDGAGEDDLAECGSSAASGRPAGPARAPSPSACSAQAADAQRGAADHHQVGRAPERHVLAEDPVPDVVEREAEQGAGAAPRSSGRRSAVPAGRHATVEVRVGRWAARGRSRLRADAEEPGEDEVVGGVGERPGSRPWSMCREMSQYIPKTRSAG